MSVCSLKRALVEQLIEERPRGDANAEERLKKIMPSLADSFVISQWRTGF